MCRFLRRVSTGLDLAIEQYLPRAGIASLGFFAKNVKNYIVTDARQTTYQKSGGNLGLALLTSFTNGETARVYGLEANYVQRFADLLPGPLAGLGVSANWTWVQSKYTVPVLDANGFATLSRDSVLPSTSKNTVNAELLYQHAGLDLTLGAYYTSPNIFGVGQSTATDIWTQDRLSVEFGSHYTLNDTFGFYFNTKNLTNTPLKFTEGRGESRVIQREFYGVTLQAGVTLKF